MCVFFRGATVAWVVHFFWHHVWVPALEARIYFGSKSMLVSLSLRFDMNHASKESAYEEKTCQEETCQEDCEETCHFPGSPTYTGAKRICPKCLQCFKGETLGWCDRKELPWSTCWTSRLCEFATVVAGCHEGDLWGARFPMVRLCERQVELLALVSDTARHV